MHDDYPWTDYSVSPAHALPQLRAWLEQMHGVPGHAQREWIERHVDDEDDREALLRLLESDANDLEFRA